VYGAAAYCNITVSECKIRNLKWLAIFLILHEFDGHVHKVNMHHAEILIGHFREMVGNWPVASCYFALWCIIMLLQLCWVMIMVCC